MYGSEVDTWLRPAATLTAIAAIVLVFVNAVLVVRNQEAQREVNQRQQVINQGVQLARASQLLVESIAKVAVASKDDRLTTLLERHGVHLTVNPPAEGAKP